MFKAFLILCIRLYQLCISPFLPSRCRFYPTCSNYAIESFRRYSFIKALVLSLKRLMKCHPFHRGGIDDHSDCNHNDMNDTLSCSAIKRSIL